MTTVTVGCKLPSGLVMELIEVGNGLLPAVKGKTVTLAGANSLRVGMVGNPLNGRFATTQVEEEFAKAWFERNKNLECVRTGLVFPCEKPNAAESMAKERDAVKTGLEPLDPKKPPSGIEVDKERLRLLRAA